MITRIGLFSIGSGLIAGFCFSLAFTLTIGLVWGLWTAVVSACAGIIGKYEQEAEA